MRKPAHALMGESLQPASATGPLGQGKNLSGADSFSGR
jgi:hypothetical protein